MASARAVLAAVTPMIVARATEGALRTAYHAACAVHGRDGEAGVDDVGIIDNIIGKLCELADAAAAIRGEEHTDALIVAAERERCIAACRTVLDKPSTWLVDRGTDPWPPTVDDCISAIQGARAASQARSAAPVTASTTRRGPSRSCSAASRA